MQKLFHMVEILNPNINTLLICKEHLDTIKDLGVIFDSKLKFDHHINDKINKANSILGIIEKF